MAVTGKYALNKIHYQEIYQVGTCTGQNLLFAKFHLLRSIGYEFDWQLLYEKLFCTISIKNIIYGLFCCMSYSLIAKPPIDLNVSNTSDRI